MGQHYYTTCLKAFHMCSETNSEPAESTKRAQIPTDNFEDVRPHVLMTRSPTPEAPITAPHPFYRAPIRSLALGAP